MKPIKLRIKGLNSFIEEQIIDFNKLTDRGLFGIFGPTGSGKSTILDGITLALYGNVSRKSSNFINTNCEKLNVNFEFQISGKEIKRYIIDREFKRKKDGGIVSGKCKIVDITKEEEILADGVKSINKKVEEIIGLNIEDFSRTVVLPQGKFSEFLKLEGKDRRDMLERLFNLQLFGDELTKKLTAKISKEKNNKNILIGQLTGYNDISKEKLKEKDEIVEEIKNKLKVLTNELEVLKKRHKENEELWTFKNELNLYKNNEKILKEKEAEINSYIEKIRLGESAEKIIPYINSFENIKIKFEKNEIDLNNISLKINKIKDEKEQIEKKWILEKDNKENKLPKLMMNENKVKDAIEEKKILDEIEKNIKILNLNLNDLENKDKKLRQQLINLEKEGKNKSSYIKSTEEKYESLKIEEHLKEAVQEGIILEEKLSNIKVNLDKDIKRVEGINKENNKIISNGKDLRSCLDKRKKELEQAELNYGELVKSSKRDPKELVDLNKIIMENDQKWKDYNKFNIEISNAKDEIEENKQQVIKNLEEEKKLKEEVDFLKNKLKKIQIENIAHELRKELKEGDICPVCGSSNHVYENINKLEIFDTKSIEREINLKENNLKNITKNLIEKETLINSLNEKIKFNKSELDKLGEKFKEISLEDLKNKYNQLEEDIDKYNKEKERFEKNINELKDEINIKTGEINKLIAIVKNNQRQIKDLEKNINENTKEEENINNGLEMLKKETLIVDFLKKYEEIKVIEKDRSNLEKIIKSSRKDLEDIEKNKESLNNKINSIKENLAKVSTQLFEYEKNKDEKIISIKNKVDIEGNLESILIKIQKEIESININYEIIENKKNKIEMEFNENNEKLISLIGIVKELEKRRIEQEEQLNLQLNSEGFISINEAKKYLMEKDKINEYKLKVENYRSDILKVKGAIESLLKQINGRELKEDDYIKVKEEKDLKEKQVNLANEEKIKEEELLKNIKIKLQEQKELLDKKSKLEYKLGLLSDLEKLFKGKKFVEFVAQSKLKYISIEASRRLREITNGNYGLEVDENSRFIIRDYKNGGAKRDSTTLSGGETFLASLSLALALSAQIQLKGAAPLELFFLDEGFGTLDDDLLEVVMESLEKIHNEKMKVGIISHVESIKNRVPVKLMITPAESGMGGSKVKIERN